MTGIVFHDGKLHGDRRLVVFESNYSFPSDGPKIFLSANRQFAYGTTGSMVENHELYQTQLHAVLLECKDTLAVGEEKLCEDMEANFKVNQTGIVITKTCMYLLSKRYNKITRYSNDTICAIGTTEESLTTSLRFGLTPKQAYEVASKTCITTSSKFDTIIQSKLKVLK